MKRLYSYWTYPFVFFPLLLGFYLTNLLFTNYDISIKVLIIGILLNTTFISLFIGLFSIFKRVYLNGISLHIYDLFSNDPIIIPLNQLRNLERDNSPRTVILGVYEITFLLEEGDYKVSFFKNKFIWNIRKYI